MQNAHIRLPWRGLKTAVSFATGPALLRSFGSSRSPSCPEVCARGHSKQSGPGCKSSLTERVAASCHPQVPSKLKMAVKQGLVPKARRPFALYMQKCSARTRLPAKERNLEMARIGKQWAKLEEKEKDVFFQASRQEFQLQRDVLMRVGIKTRYKAKSQESLEELVAKPTSSSDIGPYKVHHCQDEAVLGSGTYGTVFAAYSRDGCFVALKIFRSQQHGAQEATQEANCYKQLDQLPLPAREWFPTMLGVDSCGWPWPWLALAYAGTSLANHLHAQSSYRKKPVATLLCNCRVHFMCFTTRQSCCTWISNQATSCGARS